MKGTYRLVKIDLFQGDMTRLEWHRVDNLLSETVWTYYYDPDSKADLVAAYDAAQQFANRNDLQEG